MARSNGYECDIVCSNCGYHFDELKEYIPVSIMDTESINGDRFEPFVCPSCGKRIINVRFIPEYRSYAVFVEE